ncbi:MAG: SCO family protein [Chitinophagaceae bacterium]
MSKKGWIYLGAFGVLAVVFYLVVKDWIVRSDTISVVKPFSFRTQDGNTFTNNDVAGKVYVAEYFFTSCPGICPVMNNNMRQVYDRFKKEPGFMIVSHTCDPERDSVQQLKRYSDSMGVDTKHWVFVTGRKDSLYNMARLSYTIDDPANNLLSVDDDFLHTQFWALVNQKGEVKRVYDGLKEKEIREMMTEINKLLNN